MRLTRCISSCIFAHRGGDSGPRPERAYSTVPAPQTLAENPVGGGKGEG